MKKQRAIDFFEAAKCAAIRRENICDALEELNYAGYVSGVSYDGSNAHGSDTFASVDNKLVSITSLSLKRDECNAVIDDALEVLYGKKDKGGIALLMGFKYADIVCAHYLDLRTWREIAQDMGCSHSWCMMLSREVMNFIDRHGFAYVREAEYRKSNKSSHEHLY